MRCVCSQVAVSQSINKRKEEPLCRFAQQPCRSGLWQRFSKGR
nr:MAG TPA: hypothetical protein [Caudoviricetes sp.]